MSMSEHERQYTPSEWGKRYKGQEVIQHLVKLAEKVIVDARNLSCEVDVPYGSTKRTKYDIYGTNLPADAPVFIFFHGGYWQEMTKESSCFPVPMLVANGIKVVMVEYDLCPDVRLEDIVQQTKSAIEHILKSFISQPRCVWIAGHSAGAHLAASLLYDEKWIKSMKEKKYLSSIKGFVLIAGIYELQPLVQTSYNDALKLTESEIRDYSFIKTDTKGKEPISGLKVIVTAGECDSPVFIDNSRAISQSLLNFVDDVEHILLRDNIDHFDILEKLIDSEYFLTKLIIHHMSQ